MELSLKEMEELALARLYLTEEEEDTPADFSILDMVHSLGRRKTWGYYLSHRDPGVGKMRSYHRWL